MLAPGIVCSLIKSFLIRIISMHQFCNTNNIRDTNDLSKPILIIGNNKKAERLRLVYNYNNKHTYVISNYYFCCGGEITKKIGETIFFAVNSTIIKTGIFISCRAPPYEVHCLRKKPEK